MKNNNDLRILVISKSPWDDSNANGNTLSNFFGDWKKENLLHLYFMKSQPNNEACINYINFNEIDILKSRISKQYSIAKRFKFEKKSKIYNTEQNIESRLTKYLSIYDFNIISWIRESIWLLFKFNESGLINHINEFNPDVIFYVGNNKLYSNRIYSKIIKETGLKSVIFIADDLYTYKQFYISPLSWIRRFLLRRSISKAISISDRLCVITSNQKMEYDKIFCVDSKILFKGAEFDDDFIQNDLNDSFIKLVYTGNLVYGRWKTIYHIGKVLDKLNNNGFKAKLFVYSGTKLVSKMRIAFNKCKSINFMGSISSKDVINVQKGADILVHVESMDLKEKLMTRLSFSTKLVDYFSRGKCIFAVGWKKSSSIDYLVKNDAAIAVTKIKELEPTLSNILSNSTIINEYGIKAWNCGKKNHQINKIREELYNYLINM